MQSWIWWTTRPPKAKENMFLVSNLVIWNSFSFRELAQLWVDHLLNVFRRNCMHQTQTSSGCKEDLWTQDFLIFPNCPVYICKENGNTKETCDYFFCNLFYINKTKQSLINARLTLVLGMHWSGFYFERYYLLGMSFSFKAASKQPWNQLMDNVKNLQQVSSRQGN